MKRSPMPPRTKPLARGTALTAAVGALARTPLARVSAKRAAQLAEVGRPMLSTILPRQRDTGPTRQVRAVVRVRSGGWCEFPTCPRRAAHVHHRYERGNGGTGPKSPAAAWINQPANLLDACAFHNDWCSNQQPEEAGSMGWLLKNPHQPADTTPVWTRHSLLPVLLDNTGSWAVWRGAA